MFLFDLYEITHVCSVFFPVTPSSVGEEGDYRKPDLTKVKHFETISHECIC